MSIKLNEIFQFFDLLLFFDTTVICPPHHYTVLKRFRGDKQLKISNFTRSSAQNRAASLPNELK